MKNVFLILKSDIKALFKQFFATVIVIAILFIPALYAWFNIYANWDPYGNTGNITIAVASDDLGYDNNGEFVRMGDSVLRNLAAKDTINFVVYEDSNEALRAMESGEAYAAIILKEDFSRNMYDLANALNHPESTMTYYENYKLNAVANKITESASSTVNTSVQQAYLEVLFDTIFSKITGATENADLAATENTLLTALTRLRTSFSTIAESLDRFSTFMTDTAGVLEKVDTTGAGSMVSQAGSSIESQNPQETVNSVLNWMDNLVNTVLSNSISNITKLSGNGSTNAAPATDSTQTMTQDSEPLNSAPAVTSDELYSLAEEMNAEADLMLELAGFSDTLGEETEYLSGDDVQDLVNGASTASTEEASSEGAALNSDEASPAGQGSSEPVSESSGEGNASGGVTSESGSAEIAAYAEGLQAYAVELNDYADRLAAAEESGNTEEISSIGAELYADDTATTITDYYEALKNTFNSYLMPYIRAQAQLFVDVYTDMGPLLTSLGATLNSLTPVAKSASNTLTALNDTMSYLVNTINNVIAALDDMIDVVQTVFGSELVDTLFTMLGGDSGQFAEFFACPVTIETVKVYPLSSYGSGMAPFYSTLAVWVGCVVLAAIIKVHADPRDLENVTENQLYWSRFIIYLVLNEIQTMIIYAGDLLILGVQCVNVELLFLSAAVTSFVFTAFIYSMVVSFGDIGKAIVVVIMVLQIAGSGGTYPIEILSDIFEKVYRLFPFPYAINAQREAICGLYGNDIYKYLAELMIFGVMGILIGLFVRKPFVPVNEFVEEEMEETGVF